MRRGRPSLVGTMARTAVIAGTATATVGAVQGAQQQKAAAAQQQAAAQQAAEAQQQAQAQQVAELQQQMEAMQAQEAQQAVATATPPPAPAATDMMAHLTQLAQMKEAGMLSDEEFTAAKAKLLAG